MSTTRPGKNLDDTVFYLRFAQELREIIGLEDEDFLLKLLHDTNHIAQELTSQGRDPHMVFESILKTGRTLRQTTGLGFYADVQEIHLNSEGSLFCFQLPCGGSVYILRNNGRLAMSDTGFGILHREMIDMLAHFGLDPREIERICITHADADHSGGGAFFDAPALLHPGSVEIIRSANRALWLPNAGIHPGRGLYKTDQSVFPIQPTHKHRAAGGEWKEKRNGLTKLGAIDVCGLSFEVLESLGGHLHGHIFFLSVGARLMFTGDCLINFDSLTKD